MVQDLSESIIVTDLAGKIVYYNKFSEKLFGYSPQEILGRHITTLGVKRPNVLREIRGGNTFRGEVMHKRKGGVCFPSYVIASPQRRGRKAHRHGRLREGPHRREGDKQAEGVQRKSSNFPERRPPCHRQERPGHLRQQAFRRNQRVWERRDRREAISGIPCERGPRHVYGPNGGRGIRHEAGKWWRRLT